MGVGLFGHIAGICAWLALGAAMCGQTSAGAVFLVLCVGIAASPCGTLEDVTARLVGVGMSIRRTLSGAFTRLLQGEGETHPPSWDGRTSPDIEPDTEEEPEPETVRILDPGLN